MSKKKPIDDDILDASGNPYPVMHSNLLRIMMLHGIQKIEIDYSGSGDSGGADEIKFTPDTIEESVKKEASDIAEELIYSITGADFNNDGSSGNITLELKDSKIKMSGEHHEYYTESKTTSYGEGEDDDIIIDGSHSL